jgi:hypothetical protein
VLEVLGVDVRQADGPGDAFGELAVEGGGEEGRVFAEEIFVDQEADGGWTDSDLCGFGVAFERSSVKGGQ